MKLTTFIFFLSFFVVPLAAQQSVIKVEVKQEADGKWQLYRDNQPYFVKGVGGQTELDKAVEIGANSIRTWSADDAGIILDEAYSKGLTVMLGLWVQHERHGFNYDDTEKVAAQLAYFTTVVTQYKDHPALLLWGIGNEVDLNYTNTNVWYAINDIAKMVHAIDPNHPTITVTAGLDADEVKLINERAPAIDIYGINTYGDINNIKRNIVKYGWKGPYMITEWGPNGHWEVAKTAWGAPIEQNSTEKAKSYSERYTSAIAADQNNCIGSYVFLWGFKQETTSTWYGLFSDKHEVSQAVNELELLWTGQPAKNRAPIIDSAVLNNENKGADIYLKSDDKYDAKFFVTDFDKDRIKYKWEVVPESKDIKSGGDVEAKPNALTGISASKHGNTFTFRTPNEEGAYRLFIYAYDKHNNYTYTNIPFYAVPRTPEDGEPRFIQFKKQTMQSFQ